uniref:phenylalanine--tRNA ligase n=1 Tax=Leptobrachium leishanense TaxID=445787 RepID=A0A8C5MSE0_9ANUR
MQPDPLLGEDTAEKPLNILLVGEGNFSFSAALCDASHGEYRITTTCYDDEDRILRQPFAWGNVQQLRSRGALVHFGVDATSLTDYEWSSAAPYDRVIFNFPHCGRKAGVKKNRELLAKFFQSCADVLSQKGDIHVALCQGQGGTPADHPVREWHNSWQVTAMAAKAGFILSAVHPFGASEYNGYQCTGYKSQEKSFHVSGSLNHVFTRSLPLDNLIPLDAIARLTEPSPSTITEGDCDISTERNKNFLKKDPCHPTNLLNEELLAFFERRMIIKRLEDTFPLVYENGQSQSSPWCSVMEANLYHVPAKTGETASQGSHNLHEMCSHEQDNLGNRYGARDGYQGQNSSFSYLRPSLTHCIDPLIKDPLFPSSSLHVLSGPVFKRCLVSQCTMPVFLETLLVLSYQKGNVEAERQVVMDTIESFVASRLTSVRDGTESLVIKELGNQDGKNIVCFRKNISYGGHQTMHLSSTACDDQAIGQIMNVAPGQLVGDFGLLLVTFNIDLLAMRLLDLTDWRLLWTADDRFAQQYKTRRLAAFQHFSLYPPHYVHDVSFWVEEGSAFDELEFHCIVRRVSKGTVTKISLQDRFENLTTGKTSLCYRITYQSCDRALSYQAAAEMQMGLRDELQRCLNVTLR